MSRLFNANMMRLKASWVFLLGEVFMVGYAIFVYANAGMHVAQRGVVENWNIYFYNVLLLSGITMAIFVSIFLNREYGDGAIRNKLMVGHRRRDIYLVNFATCLLAGMIMCTTYYLSAVFFGFLCVGKEILQIQNIGAGIFYSILVFAVYTAFFVLVEMLDRNKARSVEINLIGALVILVLGMMCYGELMGQPDTAGFVWHIIGLLFPSTLVMYVAGAEQAPYISTVLALLAETACLVGFGVWKFEGKDIQ